MIERLEHVGIGVKDMDKSVAFYRDVVGYQVFSERPMTAPNSKIKKLVFMRQGDDIIELLHMPDGYPGVERYESLGTSHICFAVQGIQAEIDRWAALGVPQVVPATPTADGGMRAAFSGPDGEYIELKGK